MSDWLENTFVATKTLRECANELEYLASSFADVGNFHMAKRLSELSRDIHESSEAVRKATREASNELLHTAQSGAFSTMRMALAMAGIKEVEKEEESNDQSQP